MLSCVLVDGGHRGRDNQPGCTTYFGCNASRYGDDLFTETHPAVGKGLAVGNARTDELDDLR